MQNVPLYFMCTLQQCGWTDTDSPIANSFVTFFFIAWYFSLSEVNKNTLNKTVKMSTKIAGKQHHSMTMLCKAHVLRKGQVILSGVSSEYELLPPKTGTGICWLLVHRDPLYCSV